MDKNILLAELAREKHNPSATHVGYLTSVSGRVALLLSEPQYVQYCAENTACLPHSTLEKDFLTLKGFSKLSPLNFSE